MPTTTPVTETKFLLPKESGSRFSNEGATTQVAIFLPPCAPDLEFEFVIVENQYLRVGVTDTETQSFIYQQGEVSGNAVSLKHNGIGSTLRVVGLNNNQWGVMGIITDHTWDE